MRKSQNHRGASRLVIEVDDRTGSKHALVALPRAFASSWHFRLLHLAGLLVTLPVFAATRLLPGRWHELHDESVFVETNRAVLTALGFAFMA